MPILKDKLRSKGLISHLRIINEPNLSIIEKKYLNLDHCWLIALKTFSVRRI